MQTREASLGVSAGDGEEGLEGVGGQETLRRRVEGGGEGMTALSNSYFNTNLTVFITVRFLRLV